MPRLRWRAARALGARRRGGVRRWRRRSASEQVARVREAIMTALMRVGDEAKRQGAAALTFARRMPACARRAIEALQALPDAISAIPGATAGGRRFRRAHVSPPSLLETCLPRMPRMLCAGCWNRSSTPKRLRGGNRSPCGGRDERRDSRASDRAPIAFPNSVSELCGVNGHRSDFELGRLGRKWHVQSFTDLVPSMLPKKRFGASANFFIAAPACRSPTASDITSTAVWPSGLLPPDSPSFQAYFAMLRSDADHEIEYLINAFTVNETYFYREEHQLRCMTSDLLDDAHQAEADRANRSASGRFPARPARSLIRSQYG